MTTHSVQNWEQARAWIKDSTAVLVVAGAGFSSGTMVPGPGHDDSWEGIPQPPNRGGMDWAASYRTAEEMWAKAGPGHLRTIRGWCRLTNGAFSSLSSLLEDKPHFIFTSNVDHRFHNAGFNPERIYCPQGDMATLQCTRGPECGVGTPAEPVLCKLIDGGGIDEKNWVVAQEELLPRCPACSAPLYKWTRHNALFTHGPSDAAQAAMIQWLKKQDANLVILEVGCGMSTPSVCRFPAEAIARDLQAKFVRVSYDATDAQVPDDLAQSGRAVSCVGDSSAAMAWLAAQGPVPVADPQGNGGYNAYGQYIGNRIKFAPPHVRFEQWLGQLRDH